MDTPGAEWTPILQRQGLPRAAYHRNDLRLELASGNGLHEHPEDRAVLLRRDVPGSDFDCGLRNLTRL